MVDPTPTLHEFLVAHRFILRFTPPTPLLPASRLQAHYGLQLHTKHENLSPVRSFKLRGALYRLSLLSAQERAAGVVTASTGNHGLAIAHAASVFGTRSVVVVPNGAVGLKLDRIATSGAELRTTGSTLGEAIAAAREISEEEDLLFIEDGDDPGLLVGAGTISLEILAELPQVEVLLVPVGGGNLIAGMAACAKQLNPRITVVGVQTEAARAVHDSWEARRVVCRPPTTFASGLAADHPGKLALDVILKWVDDIVLVTETDLRSAMLLAIEEIGQVLEGAGAASLAALAQHGETWRGKCVVALLSGGNADEQELYESMAIVRRASDATATLAPTPKRQARHRAKRQAGSKPSSSHEN